MQSGTSEDRLWGRILTEIQQIIHSSWLLVCCHLECVKHNVRFLQPYSLFLPVCEASVAVEVAPKVEAVKGETAQLPCKYTVSPPTTNTIVEWYIVSHVQILCLAPMQLQLDIIQFLLFICFLIIQKEEQGTRMRVAFRSQGGQGQSDVGTPLTGRVSIGEDLSLTISSVRPSDELIFYCQVTAGPAGLGDAATMLKVFCE